MKSAAVILMILITMAKTLRHRTEPKVSFFRNESRTRQRRATGIEMTRQSSQMINLKGEVLFLVSLRMKSVKTSKIVASSTASFSLDNAWSVTQASIRRG